MPWCDPDAVSAPRTERSRHLQAVHEARGNDEGWVVDGIETRVYTVLVVNVDVHAGRAEVRICDEDAAVVRIPADPATDSAEVVVNDDFISSTKTWVFLRESDEWLGADVIDENQTIGRENNQCV